MSLKIKNKRVLLKKLEGNIAMTLAKYEGQELTQDKIDAMTSGVVEVLGEVVENFNAEAFEFTIHRDKDKFTIEPNNFITALWLKGVNATINEINNDHYQDAVAVYQWEDDKLVVTPKARADLL